MMQKRILFQMIGAVLGAIFISFLSFIFLSNIQNSPVKLNFGGDKSVIFGFLFLGIPLGSCFGIYLVDKIFFKSNAKFLGLIFSFLLCFFIGGFGSVLLIAMISYFALFLIPFLFFATAFLGYYLPRKSRIGVENKKV